MGNYNISFKVGINMQMNEFLKRNYNSYFKNKQVISLLLFCSENVYTIVMGLFYVSVSCSKIDLSTKFSGIFINLLKNKKENT